MGMYGQALGITRKYFRCLVKEYYKEYNINWTAEDGISPRCVKLQFVKNMIFLIMFLILVKTILLKLFQKIEITRH
jgi:hypothetical protein